MSGETCSINRCTAPADSADTAQVGPWTVTIPYCHEHAREMAEGTPLGPVGIDASKVVIEPVGTKEPSRNTGRFPGIA